MTSHPSPRSVADLFAADGRLKAVPRRPARREALLAHLAATLFDDGRDYRESEVNEALLTVHEDFSALRRYLVIGGFLARTKDGSAYRRQQQTGSPEGAITAVA
ncbi:MULTISPECIES: DUF2087 domain-containing protein [unclassified Streptomyces]|uniref:DUF2087 domain-containing protein n=1 Tax=unclassified Streptomyces TaxID=2593676 RepID=UPI0006FB0CA0|nr:MULTISPECIES: DUF2087 domain-containing protein [unclassified Streptomyces]KQX59416.1 hypothetical protein ASD33_03820 [Streptomyces sp. Root1304]KRB00676.1 hypothetical protein ASE09_03820 [Streptomyces sp. Root66D1]